MLSVPDATLRDPDNQIHGRLHLTSAAADGAGLAIVGARIRQLDLSPKSEHEDS
jgi:hypothetical protein